MSDTDKLAAIRTALAAVPDSAISAVADALDIAIPRWAWVSAHVNDTRYVMEHAVEEGRVSVVDHLKTVLQLRADKKEHVD